MIFFKSIIINNRKIKIIKLTKKIFIFLKKLLHQSPRIEGLVLDFNLQ
jgi:hypothetical protein